MEILQTDSRYKCHIYKKEFTQLSTPRSQDLSMTTKELSVDITWV